jgi:pSer/pThr/pTyr-binding forkhead associated (FHA) protein
MESTQVMKVQPKLPPIHQLQEAVCQKCQRKLLDSTVCLYCTQSGFDAMQYLKAVAEQQRAAELSDRRPANVLRSENGAEQYKLNEAELSIGRHPSNRIVILEDRAVSRHHATVRFRGGEFFIQDNKSANGTFVNGQLIDKPTRILNGDVITIGNENLIAAYHQDKPPE